MTYDIIVKGEPLVITKHPVDLSCRGDVREGSLVAIGYDNSVRLCDAYRTPALGWVVEIEEDNQPLPAFVHVARGGPFLIKAVLLRGKTAHVGSRLIADVYGGVRETTLQNEYLLGKNQVGTIRPEIVAVAEEEKEKTVTGVWEPILVRSLL